MPVALLERSPGGRFRTTFFEEILGYGGVDVFEQPLPSNVSEPSGLDLIVQEWVGSGHFGFTLTLYMDETTSVLRGIELSWGTDGSVLKDLTLRMILRELGAPSAMWIAVEGPPVNGELFAQVNIVYDEGIVFYLQSGIAADVAYSDALGDEVGSVEFCLDRTVDGGVLLTEPLPRDWKYSLRERHIPLHIVRAAVPIEQAFEIRLDQLADLAHSSGDACITGAYPFASGSE